MKQFALLLSFFALSFSSTFAQTARSAGSNDPAAKKILDAVSAKFKTYKTVQAKFNLKIENAAGKTLGSKSGTVYMKGSKYRISITGQEVFSDGSNVWTFDKAANEATINKIDASGNSITPQKLFTNFYDKDFLYKLNTGSAIAGTKEIELTPVDKTKPFFKILLYVKNDQIVSTKLFEKAGNRYTYSTTGLTPNTNVADATFAFDAKKYPGVEVVDLR